MMRRLAAIATSFVLALVARDAHADDTPDKGRIARAYARFHDGEVLFEQKRVDEACAAFEESQRLDPTLGTLLNVAFCHEAQGKTATAWNEYNAAAAWAAQQGRPDREKFAYEHSSELAKKLSRVQLVLPERSDALEILVDGHPHAARVTALLYLDPGEHKLRVTSPRKKPFETTFQVSLGPSSLSMQVPALVDDVVAAAPVDAPREGSETGRVLGFALVGVGVVGFGLGTYFGVRTLDKKSEGRAHCAGAQCDAQGVAAYDDATTASTVSTIAFGAGIAGLAAGLWLLVTNPSAPVRVAPLVGPRVGGLRMEASW